MSHPSEKEKKNGKNNEHMVKCYYFRAKFQLKSKKIKLLRK